LLPEFFRAEGFAEVADHEDLVAGALVGVDGEADGGLVFDGGDHLVALEQAIEPFAAAFGFFRPLTGAESSHKFFLLFDVGLLFFVCALLGEFGEGALF